MCNKLMLCIEHCTKWIFPGLIYFIMSLVSLQWIRPLRRNTCTCPCPCTCTCTEQNTTQNEIKGQDRERNSPIRCAYEISSCIVGIIMVIISIPAVAINIIPLVIFIIGWAECPYTHSSICYTLQFHFGENKSIPKLILRDIPKGMIEHNPTNST